MLVTGDVKEDWWEEKRGRKIGPRKELLNEIYTTCENLEIFHMYNTSTFLKYAKQEIDEHIKDSSIEDARKLIILNTSNERQVNELAKLRTLIQFSNEKIRELNEELQKAEMELQRTNNYRNKLYNESTAEEDIRDYAHNLGYMENDLEDEIDLIKKKLSTLYQYKAAQESKLEFYKRDFELL